MHSREDDDREHHDGPSVVENAIEFLGDTIVHWLVEAATTIGQLVLEAFSVL